MPDSLVESDEETEEELDDDMVEFVLGLLRHVWCPFLLRLVVRLLNLRRGCLSGDKLRLLSLELEDVERLNLLHALDEFAWVLRPCLRAPWCLVVTQH